MPRPFGPEVTFFGIATADNVLRTPASETDDGVPIYDWPTQAGFIIVLEGRPGTSNKPLASCGLMDGIPCNGDRAAPQILADRPLGNGSPAVCDDSPPTLGGVPGIMSLDFSGGENVTNAINDLACRFDAHAQTELACTLNDLGNFSFEHYFGVNNPNNSTLQYCSVPALGQELALKSGETRFKARILDTAGNVGNTVEIVVRVP